MQNRQPSSNNVAKKHAHRIQHTTYQAPTERNNVYRIVTVLYAVVGVAIGCILFVLDFIFIIYIIQLDSMEL